MKALLLFIFSVLVVLVAAGTQNALPTVVRVGDGNTLRFRTQGKTITIRFGGVYPQSCTGSEALGRTSQKRACPK